MMENLSIYDSNMRCIGAASNTQVHQVGHWHKVAHVWIYDSVTESIFIQRRSGNKSFFPGYLDISVAGHCRTDEAIEQTATREIQEEINLTCDKGNLQYVGVRRYSYSSDSYINNEFQYIFILTIALRITELEFNDGEVAEAILLPVKSDFSAKDISALLIGKDKKLLPIVISMMEFIPATDNYQIRMLTWIKEFISDNTVPSPIFS